MLEKKLNYENRMKTELKPFYFTFGQKYSDEPHPNYPKAHPSGYVTIMASDYMEARTKSIDIFGKGPKGDVLFAFQYDDTDFKPGYFPMGEIERFEYPQPLTDGKL